MEILTSSEVALLIFSVLFGTALGAALVYIYLSSKISRLRVESSQSQMETLQRLSAAEALLKDSDVELKASEQQVVDLQRDNTALNRTVAELNERSRNHEREIELFRSVEERLMTAFKALSSDALSSNNRSFIELAQNVLATQQQGAVAELEKRETAISELVKPVKESLDKFEQKVQEIEKARVGAYEGLNQQVRSLFETQQQLKSETNNLVRALGTPRVRGRWGEMQLRRVVELAGMLEHSDFVEQESVNVEDGRLRPDLIVKLPGGKNVVIDAKAPLAAYLEAFESPDDNIKKSKMLDHARHLRDHASSLGRKAYWEQFSPTPEFVVLFVPGESFFSAALESDPELIDRAVGDKVIFATPTTLIALLKAVAYGWRQEILAENAAKISKLGRELYSRISTVGDNLSTLGDKLGSAVDSYNKAIFNIQDRVLVTARKFNELQGGEAEDEIPTIQPVDQRPREVRIQLPD